MKKRINCPECGKEMNLMGLRWHVKCIIDNSVLDRVLRAEDIATQ